MPGPTPTRLQRWGLVERFHLDVALEGGDRLLAIAERISDLAKKEDRTPLPDEIPGARGELEGALPRLEPLLELSCRPEAVSQRTGDGGLAGVIAQGLRQRFRLSQMARHAREVAEGYQRGADVEPEVDGLGLPVWGLGQPCQRRHRLLERGHRFAVRLPGRGLLARLARVPRRFVPHLAAQGVMGEAIDVLGQSIGVEPLDGGEDPCVQLSTALLEQAAIRDFMREGMLEGVWFTSSFAGR